MIVRYESDGSIVMITQNDHAQLSGLFASHWGNDKFEKPRPYGSMVRAAMYHDRGWINYETSPQLNPETGKTPSYREVPNDKAQLAAFEWAGDWLGSWTIFYWAWWISWSPFVGMFIARISRGRTIREFVTGVLLVPSTVSLVWFAIFGGAAIKAQEMGATLDKFGDGEESTLFALLDSMPWAGVTSILVMVLVAIFFVSGADAASIVMGSLCERGTLEPNRFTVIFWGVATGAAAAIMLTIGGEDSLTGLQQITIIAALPFVLIMIGMAVALVKDLQSDPMAVRRAYAVEALKQAVVAGVKEHGDDFVLSIDHAEPGEGIDRDKVLHPSNGGSATATEQAETDPRPGQTPTA